MSVLSSRLGAKFAVSSVLVMGRINEAVGCVPEHISTVVNWNGEVIWQLPQLWPLLPCWGYCAAHPGATTHQAPVWASAQVVQAAIAFLWGLLRLQGSCENVPAFAPLPRFATGRPPWILGTQTNIECVQSTLSAPSRAGWQRSPCF